MGFVINADLETSQGPTQELYIRIDGFTFNKVTAHLGFQVSYWLDREYSIRHNRVFLEDEIKPMKGIVQNKFILFDDTDPNGKEIVLETYINAQVAEEKETEIPIFGMKSVKESVPYVSFDEEGEELIKYREIFKEKKVQIGTEKEIRKVIDLKAFNNLYEYSYKKLFEYLCKFIPAEKIETVK